MSVQSPTYVLWGLRLPYPRATGPEFEAAAERYLDSAFDLDSVNRSDHVTVLLDGMGGEYMVVGHVLQRTGPYGNNPPLNHVPIPLYPAMDFGASARYAQWRAGIDAALAAMGVTVPSTAQPHWMVLTHYR